MDRNNLFNGIEVLDKMAILRVVDDGLKALLIPKNPDITNELLACTGNILTNADIKHGIMQRPLLQEDGAFLVAKGNAPIDGEDGRIELDVCVADHEEQFSEQLKKQFAKDDENISDPKALDLITNVRKGDVIARKIPPTHGTNGINVFGEEIPAAAGKWVAFKIGEGVEIINNTLTASLDGKVEITSDGKISVVDEWSIDGSVDASTGHVEFWGKHLAISGSVSGGFRVRVAGNLEIAGNIEDESDVQSGGDMIVKGIIRSDKTKVIVNGNLECGAVEYASVRVSGNMICNNYMLDADVKVQGDVFITGGKGLVAGGRLMTGKSVQANRLGTAAHVLTEVRTGYDPVLFALAEQLHEKVSLLFKKRNQLHEGLAKITATEPVKNGNGKKMAAIRTQIVEALKAINEEIEAKKNELASVERRVANLDTSTIQVTGTTYPNVLVAIGNAEIKVSTEVSRANFKFRNGQVVVITEDN